MKYKIFIFEDSGVYSWNVLGAGAMRIGVSVGIPRKKLTNKIIRFMQVFHSFLPEKYLELSDNDLLGLLSYKYYITGNLVLKYEVEF